MRAPQKIYRTTTYLNNKGGQTLWKRQPVAGAENIEYVQIGAFIERAATWLREQEEMVGVSFQDDFIERFKTYMKGE